MLNQIKNQIFLNQKLRKTIVSSLVLMLCAVLLQTSASAQTANDKLKLELIIAPSKTMPAADSMGIYAVEMLECKNQQATVEVKQAGFNLIDKLSGLLMPTAMASHRDHFDRPGAKIVTTRVFFEKPSSINLGEVTLSQAPYCQIRLTLTRLPSTLSSERNGLPALETSIHLSRSGKLPAVALMYPVALTLNLSAPWQAKQGLAKLTMTIDPASTSGILADASLSEGAVVRKLTERLSQSSKMQLTYVR